MAGTLESSDALVELEPVEGPNQIEIESVVYEQFGRDLEELVSSLLEEFQVAGARLILKDRGALECTIRARVETAIRRAAGKGA
jgi:citrate lyase subunit gamma (acyl carrier protein)